MTFTRQFKPSQLKSGLVYNITASLALTASYFSGSISNAIYAETASYITGISEPYHIVNGVTSAEVNPTNNIFLIKRGTTTILTVTQSGVVILATQSAKLTGTAPVGGMYFTSGSFFVGLE